jgi:predicted CXXCH cytochrome family protein
MPKTKSTGFILLVTVFVSACGSDLVYRDRDPFPEPPVGAGDFLGYSVVDSKQTTCGNCHKGKQATWQETAHADAWSTLANSGAQQTLCEACHTVSSRGNLVSDPSVGWVATNNERYHDVQCESCHGPGVTHVLNPDAVTTKPLASIAVTDGTAGGCAECHSGSHRPFAEEWRDSKHARVVESRATNPSCSGCHEAKAILQGWGVNSTFMEESAPTEHLAVTCAVCHDPHDAQHEGQLRFALNVADEEQNLCMKCHHKRGRPDLASQNRGPHSPEGPLLLGDAGWIPAGVELTGIVGSHGSDRNERMCATCHVNNHEFTDPLTGSFSFRATGHSFQAIPCSDAEGLPTGERDCTLAERSFRSCVECHLSETAARSALTVAEMRIGRLVDEIGGLIARIPESEFSTADPTYTTGEGALFNMQLAQKKGSLVHNPFLVEALLLASIRQIEIDYELTPAAGLVLDAQLTSR